MTTTLISDSFTVNSYVNDKCINKKLKLRINRSHENKEQIEISRAYERMPNPSLLATQEFMENKVYFRKAEDELFS